MLPDTASCPVTTQARYKYATRNMCLCKKHINMSFMQATCHLLKHAVILWLCDAPFIMTHKMELFAKIINCMHLLCNAEDCFTAEVLEHVVIGHKTRKAAHGILDVAFQNSVAMDGNRK